MKWWDAWDGVDWNDSLKEMGSHLLIGLIGAIIIAVFFSESNENIVVEYYISGNPEAHVIEDFNFYNKKIKAHYNETKSDIIFRSVMKQNEAPGVGYIIMYKDKHIRYSGVYTDSDILILVDEYKNPRN
jgi:hypothetical protein